MFAHVDIAKPHQGIDEGNASEEAYLSNVIISRFALPSQKARPFAPFKSNYRTQIIHKNDIRAGPGKVPVLVSTCPVAGKQEGCAGIDCMGLRCLHGVTENRPGNIAYLLPVLCLHGLRNLMQIGLYLHGVSCGTWGVQTYARFLGCTILSDSCCPSCFCPSPVALGDPCPPFRGAWSGGCPAVELAPVPTFYGQAEARSALPGGCTAEGGTIHPATNNARFPFPGEQSGTVPTIAVELLVRADIVEVEN